MSYNSTLATTLAATTEFDNFNNSGASSSQNPLEVINAHKAWGYGLTGSGQVIAIMDSGFSTSHKELDSKTITTYGTLTNATAVSSTEDHGLFVSGIAAAEDDGDTGLQGVAPRANLHFSSYDQANGNSYIPTHWANATDDAADSNAVVQNNSWGATNATISTVNSYKNNNSLTNAAALATYFTASG